MAMAMALSRKAMWMIVCHIKTFINAANYDEKVLLWQTVIHIAFLLSAIAIAFADRLMSHATHSEH